jgi:hypothetical protein
VLSSAAPPGAARGVLKCRAVQGVLDGDVLYKAPLFQFNAQMR